MLRFDRMKRHVTTLPRTSVPAKTPNLGHNALEPNALVPEKPGKTSISRKAGQLWQHWDSWTGPSHC